MPVGARQGHFGRKGALGAAGSAQCDSWYDWVPIWTDMEAASAFQENMFADAIVQRQLLHTLPGNSFLFCLCLVML